MNEIANCDLNDRVPEMESMTYIRDLVGNIRDYVSQESIPAVPTDITKEEIISTIREIRERG